MRRYHETEVDQVKMMKRIACANLGLCLWLGVMAGAAADDAPAGSRSPVHFVQVRPLPVPTVPELEGIAATAQVQGDLPVLTLVDEGVEPIDNLDFGEVDTGSMGSLVRLYVVNESPTTLATGLSVIISHPQVFVNVGDTYGPACDGMAVLPPLDICQIWLRFEPSSPGPFLGSLIVSSNGGASQTQEISLTGSGGLDRVVYGQFPHDTQSDGGSLGVSNANYDHIEPQYSSELSDDFVVNDLEGWIINKVGMEVALNALDWLTPPVMRQPPDVMIVHDQDGLPGESAACSAPGSDIAMWDAVGYRVELQLPQPCILPPGHYWLRVIFYPEGSWQGWDDDLMQIYWGLQWVNTELHPDLPLPPPHLNPPMHRNPGGGGNPGKNGIPCLEWEPPYEGCAWMEDWYSGYAYGAIFWLIGQALGAPGLDVAPLELDFGEVPVGGTSEPQSVTLSSTGTAPVEVDYAPVFTYFAQSGGDCPERPFVLDPAVECTLEFVFAPVSEGAAFESLWITFNAAPSFFDVPLTGTGIPAKPLPDPIFDDRFADASP